MRRTLGNHQRKNRAKRSSLFLLNDNRLGKITLLPVIFCGLLLPLDFLAQVDGYLYYLHPYELIFVYASAWRTYLSLSALALAAIVVAAALSAVISKASFNKALQSQSTSFALACLIFAVLDGTRRWLEAVGFVPHIHALTSGIVYLELGISLFFVLFGIKLRNIVFPEQIIQFSRVAFLLGILSLVAAAALPPGPFNSRDDVRPEPVPRSPQTGLPDIVLITVDTFSAAHMSLYGYGRPTTPNLEHLAQQAYVFDRFYANSNFTTPAINSLISGALPWTHRALIQGAHPSPLAVNQQLFAELRKEGYATLSVATNPWASPVHNLSAQWLDAVAYDRKREFSAGPIESIVSFMPYSEPVFDMGLIKSSMRAVDYSLVMSGIWSKTDQHEPELAFSAARRMVLGRNQAKPFVLWVHLFGPHQPYAPPPPFVGRFDASPENRTCLDSSPPTGFTASLDPSFPGHYIGRYDEGVAYFDASIGTFVDWLKKQGLYERSLLVVSADHGESFTHGYGSHGGPLLTDELIHIPLMIKEPFQKSGLRVSTVSSQVDLVPTVLDLVGLTPAPSIEGRSLKPAFLGNAPTGAVFSMNFQQNSQFGPLHTGTVAMIDDRWKYVHYLGHQHYPFMPKLKDELFDLVADPSESANMISAQPVISARMLGAIEEQLRLHGGPIE